MRLKRTILAGSAALALTFALAPAALATESEPPATCAAAAPETDGSDTKEKAGEPDDDGRTDAEGAAVDSGGPDTTDSRFDQKENDGRDSREGHWDVKEDSEHPYEGNTTEPDSGEDDDNNPDFPQGVQDDPEETGDQLFYQPGEVRDSDDNLEGSLDTTEGAADTTDGEADTYQEGECGTDTPPSDEEPTPEPEPDFVDKDCPELTYEEAQNLLAEDDPHRLDRDGDGVACETNAGDGGVEQIADEANEDGTAPTPQPQEGHIAVTG